MKKAISLILVLVLCLSLCACGGENLIRKVDVDTGDYFMVFDIFASFDTKPEDMPMSGIIVVSSNGDYVQVYNNSGKQKVSINTDLWEEYALDSARPWAYQDDLSFVSECLEGCKGATLYKSDTYFRPDAWYKMAS